MGDHSMHMVATGSTTMQMVNHSLHNMSSMTPTMSPATTMDHSGHVMNGDSPTGGLHEMMTMNMYFVTEWNGTNILFSSWEVTETWHMVLSCIAIVHLAALYEGLKVLREYLLVTYGPNRFVIKQSNSYSSSKDDIVVAEPVQNSVRSRMCTWLHFLQTFLHFIQVTVSYFLMLIAMTFNVWLFLSVILGAGLGYFLFGWMRAVVNDANEHCH